MDPKSTQQPPRLFEVMRRRIANNSDEGAVLNAGWQAMQTADPRLAAAVQKLPPSVAQQAVLQYTNAIRLGKDAEAGTMATQAVRTQLAEFAKQAQAQQASGFFRRASKPYTVEDFDRDLTPPAQQDGNAIGAFAGLRKFTPAPDPQAGLQQAFQGVRDKYNQFNNAKKTDYEKNLLWGNPDGTPVASKELTVPKDWAVPQPNLIKPADNYLP